MHDYQWYVLIGLIGFLLGVIAYLLVALHKTMDLIAVGNRPRDGFPQHIEAAWEDIGAHGRYLTDLGGMSIAMREQMYREFLRALNKPITTVPAAGSINDILADLDRQLTKQYEEDYVAQSTE